MSKNYKTNKEQNEKHRRILNGLLREPENKECADCTAKGPRWASTNLGVFVCMKCSGIHRHLGVHISKVRSVTLDSWTPEQVATIQRVGNKRAREVYEAHVPPHRSKPADSDDTRIIEDWIRAKYERLEFVDKEAYKKLKGETHGSKKKKKKSTSKSASSTPRSGHRKKRSAQPSSHSRQESTSSASSEPSKARPKKRPVGSKSTPASPASQRGTNAVAGAASDSGVDDLLSFDDNNGSVSDSPATPSGPVEEFFMSEPEERHRNGDNNSDFHKSASSPNLGSDPKENLHETILSLFNDPSSSSSPSHNGMQGPPPGYPPAPQQQPQHHPYPPRYPPMQPPVHPYSAPPQYPGPYPGQQYPYRSSGGSGRGGVAVGPTNTSTQPAAPYNQHQHQRQHQHHAHQTYPHSHSSFF